MAETPKRILHVLNYAWPFIDGYTVRSMGIVAAQRRYLGYDVAIAVSPFTPLTKASDPDFVGDAWGPGVQLHATSYTEQQAHETARLERPALGLSPRTSAMFRRELGSIVERLQPDIIHAHHPHFIGATALQVARERGIPFVYELRCFNGDYDLDARNPYFLLRGTYQNRLEARVCNAASAVVTISNGLARRIVAGGTPAARVFVVRNSVHADLFAADQAVAAPRAELAIGYATTFEAIENLDMFVRSVPPVRDALRARGRALRVTIAGTGRDWNRINDLVQQLGLEATVHLPGFVPYGNMPDFYRSLDLFVVPRGHAAVAADTTPLKPLEALASGLPLLVSNLPAMRELLGGRPDVRFFEPQADALAQALLQFAEQPWHNNGADVSERVWQREVRRYSGVYAVAEARGAPAAPVSPGTTLRARADRALVLPRASAKRLQRAAVDRGLFGLRPLEKHVVVCGFRRAGSTLLQLMVECCVGDVCAFGGEVEALWAAAHANRNHAYMLTKLPSDVEQIEAIRDHYRTRPGVAHVVITVRDPRAVLTSTHDAYPSSRGYYVSSARWQDVYDRIRKVQHDPDVSVLRYEDLITQPEQVEQQLTQAVGWTVQHPFAQFYEIAQARGLQRDSMTEGALGGLRPLDAGNLKKWQRPAHRERLRQVLREIPELPNYLIEMGYETDQAWLEELEPQYA